MTAPGSKELDKVVAAGHMLGEGVLGEVHHLAQVGVLARLLTLSRLAQIRLGRCVQFLVNEVSDGGQVASALKLHRLLLAQFEEA